MEHQTDKVYEAAKAVKDADALIVTAGAGIGVDSGLPDFRGNKGFWKAYPPIGKLGISFAEMANPKWFVSDPKLAWGFYGHRLNLYRRTVPHKGFDILFNWAKKMKMGYFVFTSNVDGQFQKAGFDSDFIEECHGSIHHFQCANSCSDEIWDASEIQVNVDEDKFMASAPLPLCPNCGSLARPNILMFGDWSWIADRTLRQSDQFFNYLNHVRKAKAKLVVVELGAGKAVPTVRLKSQTIANNKNSTLIRINPRDYDVPRGNIALPYGALEGVSLIDKELAKIS